MTFHHPKYYAALRAERKKLQAASLKLPGRNGRKCQAPSTKLQASSTKLI